MGHCRPLAFILSLPFALISLIISSIGAIVWIIGSIINCICPCCVCCTGIADLAVTLLKLPFTIVEWFIDCIPC
ncbi:Signaling peptide TAXIMIN 2 [Linum perenne]